MVKCPGTLLIWVEVVVAAIRGECGIGNVFRIVHLYTGSQVFVRLGVCGKIQVPRKYEWSLFCHGKNFLVHQQGTFFLGILAVVIKVNVENVKSILIVYELCPCAVAGVLGIPTLAFLLGSLGQVESSEVCYGEHPFSYDDGVEFYGVGKNDVVIGEKLHQLLQTSGTALLEANDVEIMIFDDVGDGLLSLVPSVTLFDVFFAFPANIPRSVTEISSERRN